MAERLVRRTAVFPVAAADIALIKSKLLNWCSRFGSFCFLDSNGFEDPYGTYRFLCAASAESSAQLSSANDPDSLAGDWHFGHINYDWKNVLEPALKSRHKPNTDFPDVHFFRPEIVCYMRRGEDALCIECTGHSPEDVWNVIDDSVIDFTDNLSKISFSLRIGKERYLDKIARLRQHIYEGDCYEINFCNEAFAEGVCIHPLSVYTALNAHSPAPFSAFYRYGDSFLICASPERYLAKRNQKIISQPIKGTARRGATPAEDEALKAALLASEKERAENVMIVDLVRNDLAKSCVVGSIDVAELFGIHTFPKVHQMISTVTGELRDGYTMMDAIRHSFPMGSMTGAPKYKVMQLTDHYEEARRGLFSGTVGYISPDGNADFNVVIRSLFYNANTERLSYQAGGAITWDSNAEDEWDEMRLKAEAMEALFR